MGAFETEVSLWVGNLKQWVYSHERFTWINLTLSIIPSPVSGLLALILAILQLYLCSKGKIPQTEKAILSIALVLSLINITLSSALVIYFVRQGWSLWHTFNPFFWILPLKQKLFNGNIINVMSLV